MIAAFVGAGALVVSAAGLLWFRRRYRAFVRAEAHREEIQAALIGTAARREENAPGAAGTNRLAEPPR